jgi:hypothetical protein
MEEGLATTTPFDPLGPVEAELYAQLRTAQTEQSRSIVVTADLPSDRSVRGAFLRWFLLEKVPATKLPLTQIELRAVTITGVLDLSGATLGVTPRFVNCTFDAEIKINDAKIIGFDFSGSATTILADRLSAEGSVRIGAAKGAGSKQATQIIQLRLCGAKVRGDLDLRACQLSGESNGTRESVALFADGLLVEGDALLSEGFTASGQVRLNGCKITRDLDCSGATLRNWSGYSLSAAGANISGSVYLCAMKSCSTYSHERTFAWTPFISEGTLRFEGAKVEGDFKCSGGQFTAAAFRKLPSIVKPKRQEDLNAILANGLNVGGDVRFAEADADHQFHARGVISLISARVNGDFYMEGNFDFPGEEPIWADGIVVAGTTHLEEGMHTNGLITLVQADLKQGLYVDGAEFDTGAPCHNWLEDSSATQELGGPACGIFAPYANIGGVFEWKNVKKIPPTRNPFWLYVVDSHATTIEDHKQSWRELDRFDVTGCEYSSISGLTDEIDWRLAVLDGQYAIRNRDFKANVEFAFISFWRVLQWLLLSRDHSDADVKEVRNRFRDFKANVEFAFRLFWRALQGLFLSRDHSDADVKEVRKRFRDFKANVEFAFSLFWRALQGLFLSRDHSDADVKEVRKRFKPQPYIQFAKVLRRAGYEKAANDVLVRLEQNRTRCSDFGALGQLGRWGWDCFLQYGFSPFRPVWIVLIWALVSAVLFDMAYQSGRIVPAKDNYNPVSSSSSSIEAAAPKPRVTFNAFTYAIDTLVPIVDFNQRKNWVVEPLSGEANSVRSTVSHLYDFLSDVWRDIPLWGAGALFVFNTFFGWLMTTLFAAGVAGLLRTARTRRGAAPHDLS